MHPRSYRLIFPEPRRVEATPSVLRVRPASPPPTGPGLRSGGPPAPPRELWIAAYVPQLPLLALPRFGGASAPLVVVDAETVTRASSTRWGAGGRSARRHDTGRGARGGAAMSPAARCRARTRAHAAAGRHRRRVHAAGVHRAPDGLLLEIKPSIALFGGLRALCRQLRDACRADAVLAQMHAQPHFTLAPTALAALAAARAGARCFITDPNVLPARLKPLPLATLRWPEEGKHAAARPGGAHARRAHAPATRGVRQTIRRSRGLPISTGCSAVAPIRAAGSFGASDTRTVDLDHEIEDHERILEALRPCWTSWNNSCARGSAASPR